MAILHVLNIAENILRTLHIAILSDSKSSLIAIKNKESLNVIITRILEALTKLSLER